MHTLTQARIQSHHMHKLTIHTYNATRIHWCYTHILMLHTHTHINVGTHTRKLYVYIKTGAHTVMLHAYTNAGTQKDTLDDDCKMVLSKVLQKGQALNVRAANWYFPIAYHITQRFSFSSRSMQTLSCHIAELHSSVFCSHSHNQLPLCIVTILCFLSNLYCSSLSIKMLQGNPKIPNLHMLSV